MKSLFVPIPFALGPYGINKGDVYKRILEVNGGDVNASEHNPDNILIKQLEIADEITFEIMPDNKPHIGSHVDTLLQVQSSMMNVCQKRWKKNQNLIVVGGDHSISIATGAAVAQRYDMSKVGLVWIDTHADSNTSYTSQSKSITGYPVSVLTGHGPHELSEPYHNNFIDKVVYVGIRDIDSQELEHLKAFTYTMYNIFDVEIIGIKSIARQILEYLRECEILWISIDIDVLDPIYFKKGETDLTVPGGMTPREVMALLTLLSRSGKQRIVELTQLNDVGSLTPLVVWASRLCEIAAGCGQFRYGSVNNLYTISL